MTHKSGECSSMCGINNVLAFKGGTNHKRKVGGCTIFDITVVVSCKCSKVVVISCKCKGYD